MELAGTGAGAGWAYSGPRLGHTAEQQGRLAADNVRRRHRGDGLWTLGDGYRRGGGGGGGEGEGLLYCVSVGRWAASLRCGGVVINGWLAAWAKWAIEWSKVRAARRAAAWCAPDWPAARGARPPHPRRPRPTRRGESACAVCGLACPVAASRPLLMLGHIPAAAGHVPRRCWVTSAAHAAAHIVAVSAAIMAERPCHVRVRATCRYRARLPVPRAAVTIRRRWRARRRWRSSGSGPSGRCSGPCPTGPPPPPSTAT